MHDLLKAELSELGHRWGWYFALGILLIACGSVASTFAFATTVASVVAFGWILLFAAGILGVLSFTIGRWGGFLMSLLAAILAGITGVMLLRAPLSGAAALTLVIASYLLAGGVFRFIASAVMRFPNWGWTCLSGVVSMAFGGILLAGWPAVSLWFLGCYVGIDLMTHGFSWCMFAVSLRRLARSFESGTGVAHSGAATRAAA